MKNQQLINLNDLAKDNHQNNIDKGWYEPEPTVPELLCMIHSEVSENVASYRNTGSEKALRMLKGILRNVCSERKLYLN